MNEIAGRFRPKLGSDWPHPLPAMLDAVLVDDTHFPEHTIGHILLSWSKDDTLDKQLRSALRADALAFELSDTHGGEWGDTHFGPWGSGTGESGEVITAPPRQWLVADTVVLWRQRAKAIDHHVARSRYSDAAWDLAGLVGLEREREDAIRAIDSYIGQCVDSHSEIHQEQCLRRAYTLARDIGDTSRAANVRTSLLELCRITASESYQRLRFLACDLYLLDKNSDASEEERSTLVEWMEEGLARCVSQGDPFDSEYFAERLGVYYRRKQRPEEQKRVAKAYGRLLEEWAAKGNGILATHNYKKARAVYQAAGLSENAKAVRAKVQSSTAQCQDEMAKLSTTVEVSQEDIEGFVETIVGHEWHEALRLFIGHFLHRRAEFEKQLDAWLDAATLCGIMPQTVITASGDSVDVKSPDEDRESHIVLKSTEVIHFADMFMSRTLDELFVKNDVTEEKLTAIMLESPLFGDDRLAMMKRAMKAYLLRDYISFIHLVMPQVEHAIRLLYRHIAQTATTTSRDSKRWRTLTLNHVLEDSALTGMLGEDIALYLRIVLTHDLGLNMRNLVCHGLVPQSWFSRGSADRLFHVVLLLGLLFQKQDDPALSAPGIDADK